MYRSIYSQLVSGMKVSTYVFNRRYLYFLAFLPGQLTQIRQSLLDETYVPVYNIIDRQNFVLPFSSSSSDSFIILSTILTIELKY